MAGALRITWRKSPDDLGEAIRLWGGQVNNRVYQGMAKLGPEMEASAKANAPWQDQTGNARAGLHATVGGSRGATTTVYLMHGVHYGKYLELKNGGRFAIVGPTLVQFYPKAREVLRKAFNGA